MNKPRLLLALAVCAFGVLVAGCHHVADIKRTDMSVRDFPASLGDCFGRSCNHKVYIDANCNLTDAAGTAITLLEVGVWDRVCFYNRAGCDVTLTFDRAGALFGKTGQMVDQDGCVNLSVNLEAAGDSYLISIHCECVEGGGHGNPEIKVGGGSEGGGSR